MVTEVRSAARNFAAADWLTAGVVVGCAVVDPPGWHRVASACVLFALSACFPRMADLGRIVAVAALAPVSSLGLSLGFGAVVLLRSKAVWSKMALAAAFTRSAAGPTLLVVAACTAVVVKQDLAGRVLQAATDKGHLAAAAGIGMVGAMVWGARPRAGRWDRLPLLAATLLIGANTLRILALPPKTFAQVHEADRSSPDVLAVDARIKAAAQVDAIPLLFDPLLADARRSPGLLRTLVRLAPTRDEAAASLTVDEALDAGWRPRRAEGRTVAVAKKLWDRGRGGEATRMLRRYPRVGEVDALLALFERREGIQTGWRGGVLGTVLPGEVALGRGGMLWATGTREFMVTAAAPLSMLEFQFSGQAYDGEPMVEVQLNDGDTHTAKVSSPVWISLGAIEAGVHCVKVNFVNDRVGPLGDRNLALLSIRGTE